MVQENTREVQWVPSKEWLDIHKGVIGRSTFYEGIARNEIPHIRVGRKILVRADALDLMYERRGAKESE